MEINYTLILLVDSEEGAPLVLKIPELRNIAETSKSADEKAVQIMNDISAVYKLLEKDTN